MFFSFVSSQLRIILFYVAHGSKSLQAACASTTGVSESHWVTHAHECETLIFESIEKRTEVFIAAFKLLLLAFVMRSFFKNFGTVVEFFLLFLFRSFENRVWRIDEFAQKHRWAPLELRESESARPSECSRRCEKVEKS